MSELKKPTIEGLIEKLLEENHIQENEAGTVQALLAQASNGLNKDEIFTLVTKLNDKLDAHTSDLITPNGLNYSVFESEVKTVAQVINKEKIQREKSQAQATVDPLQEKKEVEKTPEEKAEIERQQRINDNKNYLRNLIESIPGADKLGITEETIEQIAEIEDRNTLYYDRVQKIMDEKKCTLDEATKIANQEFGTTESSFESDENAVAEMTWLKKKIEEGMKSGKPQGDVIKSIYKENTVRMKALESVKGGRELLRGIATGVVNAGDAIQFSIFERLSAIKKSKENESQEKVEGSIGYIHSTIDNENGLNIKNLRSYFEDYYKNKEKLRSKTMDSNENEERKDFFEMLAQKYITTDMTISDLYNEFAEDIIVKKYELEFEDFLDGIEKNLKKGIDETSAVNNYVNDLIRAEKANRMLESVKGVIEEEEKKGKKIIDPDNKVVLEADITQQLNSINNQKKMYRDERGITKSTDELPKRKTKKIKLDITKSFSVKKLETDITRISNDRKQIIKISKELGISTDEAAQKYFKENESALFEYTRKERRILVGEDETGKDIKHKKTLTKLRGFINARDEQLIQKYTIEIESLSKKIEAGNDDPRKFDELIIKLQNTKRKLEQSQKRKKEFESKSKESSAVNLMDKKIRKNVEKEVFVRYLKSGKSALDFLGELNDSENEYDFTRDDILRIISENSRRYLTGNELHYLREDEAAIFYRNDNLERFRIERMNAEKRGLTEWIDSYDRHIKEEEKMIESANETTSKIKEKILIRMGLNPNEIGRTENTTQTAENGQVVDTEETKINNGTEIIQEQEGETGESKKSLAIEELEVTGAEIGVESLKKIAKKNKVTPKRIKDAFSKIVGLKKSKQEVVEQTEQNLNPDEKTTPTNSEGIR